MYIPATDNGCQVIVHAPISMTVVGFGGSIADNAGILEFTSSCANVKATSYLLYMYTL